MLFRKTLFPVRLLHKGALPTSKKDHKDNKDNRDQKDDRDPKDPRTTGTQRTQGPCNSPVGFRLPGDPRTKNLHAGDEPVASCGRVKVSTTRLSPAPSGGKKEIVAALRAHYTVSEAARRTDGDVVGQDVPDKSARSVPGKSVRSVSGKSGRSVQPRRRLCHPAGGCHGYCDSGSWNGGSFGGVVAAPGRAPRPGLRKTLQAWGPHEFAA